MFWQREGNPDDGSQVLVLVDEGTADEAYKVTRYFEETGFVSVRPWQRVAAYARILPPDEDDATTEHDRVLDTAIAAIRAHSGIGSWPEAAGVVAALRTAPRDEQDNPAVQCPACGYIAQEADGFSWLAAGCNGIKRGDADDLNKLECGSCCHKFYPEEGVPKLSAATLQTR